MQKIADYGQKPTSQICVVKKFCRYPDATATTGELVGAPSEGR
jgi:hypothetical protein